MENEVTHPEEGLADILEGKTKEHTELEHQMILAKQLYEEMKGPFDIQDVEMQNTVMDDWAKSKCSHAFRLILGSQEFKDSGRLFSSIGLEEVLRVAETLQ